MRHHLALTSGLLALCAVLGGPANALSMKDCSTKFQTAKQAGNTAKWNDFRKAECGTDATATPAAATTAAPPAMAAAPAATPKPAAAAPRPATTPVATPAATAPRPATTGSAAFPSAVDPKYAKESAGKARMHTCLDGYNAAKASGTLGDMKWISKGGGYYSACNTRLKG